MNFEFVHILSTLSSNETVDNVWLMGPNHIYIYIYESDVSQEIVTKGILTL